MPPKVKRSVCFKLKQYCNDPNMSGWMGENCKQVCRMEVTGNLRTNSKGKEKNLFVCFYRIFSTLVLEAPKYKPQAV